MQTTSHIAAHKEFFMGFEKFVICFRRAKPRMNFRIALPLLMIFGLASTVSLAGPEQLVQPAYSLTTRHNGDVSSGRVQLTHKDVSIGGDMGLSHSISTLSGSFVGADGYADGPQDSYDGRIICKMRNAYNFDSAFWLMVSDGTTTQIFGPDSKGPDPAATTPGVFPPVHHRGYSFSYDATEAAMVLTHPDGTKAIFTSGRIDHCQYEGSIGYLRELRSPNGFSKKIVPWAPRIPGSVTTNTGFQLRYYYLPGINAVDPQGWWSMAPAYVVGMNRAVQYCLNVNGEMDGRGDAHDNCLNSDWPTVNYQWPNKMPDIMFESGATEANKTLTVINPDKTKVSYLHSKFSVPAANCPLCARGPGSSSIVNYVRLTEMRSSASPSVVMKYEHINLLPLIETNGTHYWTQDRIGVLNRSTFGEDQIGYSISAAEGGGNYFNSGGYQAYVSAWKIRDSTGGYLKQVSAWNMGLTFNNRGVVESYTSAADGINNTYAYDTRDNITALTRQGATRYAEYEASCTSANFRYCNKPTWLSSFTTDPTPSDAIKTYFTYHAESGEVATMTNPADRQGRVAVIRYGYEKKFAKYFQLINGAVQKQLAPTGIWLKTSEKTCAITRTVGDSCVGGGVDEIVTRYEYNSDNLLLTGMTVTAADTNGILKTKRTCYQYDKFGNRIGETQPNANPASCN